MCEGSHSAFSRDGRRRDLFGIYRAALGAVGGRQSVARFLRSRRRIPGGVHLAAVGKAAVPMSAGAFDVLDGAITAALLITKHGHREDLLPKGAPVHCLESSHPVPDAASLAAGRALADFVAEAPADARFLFLISGGASSLVELLPQGLETETLQRVNRWLLGSGLDIGAMNRVRKRLSRIKGGRLAAYLGGRPALNLLISDVPGDDPRAIGSGLLIPHALSDMTVDDIDLPQWLAALLSRPPPLPEAGEFRRIRTAIVARPADAREAGRRAAGELGYAVHASPDLVVGDAVETGRRLARRLARGAPGVYVWGGETTVRLPPHPGRGGRCQSLALAAALELRGREHVWLLAAGTDGSDGPGTDAGALVDGASITRGSRAGLDAGDCLARADAGTFLEASGDLLSTGPTGTNVMDLMLGLKS